MSQLAESTGTFLLSRSTCRDFSTSSTEAGKRPEKQRRYQKYEYMSA
jgi:hypothetical protein